MAKGNTVGKTLVWVMLGLLFVGLAGVGIGGFGGTVRSIGSVGDRDISVDDYARALRQEVQALGQQIGRPVTVQQALTFGLDAQVRQRLVTTAALDDLADRIGVSAGDARLAAEIRAIPAFAGLSGGFDREAYRSTLQQNGFTEATFEARVRADIARGLIEGAVAAPVAPPAALARTIYAYAAERRNVSVLRLTEADLPAPVAAPTEADLQAFYDANPARYTTAEARRIAYAVLLPEAIVADMPVDEATLRAEYDRRIDDFVQPERRLVERLVFPDDAAATAGRNRIDAGTATFDDLVSERGLTLGDVDLGDVAETDLGEAGAAVFAVDGLGVVGPLPSALGPALFRVNGVLAAEEVPFDAARADLQVELAMDSARRAIADRIADLDDRLAAGDTLEDLANEPGMAVGTLDLTADDREGLAAYEAFRDRAMAAAEGDFPEIFQLADGGIAALRLDAIVPPALQPLPEVAGRVAEDWRADAVARALTAHAGTIEAAMAGGARLAAYGIVDVLTGLTRDGFVEGAPAALVATAFALPEGGTGRVAEGDYVAVIVVDAVTPAPLDEPEAVVLTAAFGSQTAQEIGADAFALFARAVEAGADIRLDQNAIAAVHASLP